jgi:hypothetical protein
MVLLLRSLACWSLFVVIFTGCSDTGPPKRKERARDADPPAAETPAAKPAPKTTEKTAAATKPAPAKTAPTAPPAKAAPAATTAAAKTPPAATPETPAADAAATPAAETPAAAETATAAPAADPLPSVASPTSVTIEPVPADDSWSYEKRLEQTELRMQKIVLAMIAYAKENGRMVPDAITQPSNGTPLMSWRVALLPYLGHEELYQKIRTKESWQSAGNKKFHKEMPPEYQSPWNPGLTDTTVFLAPRSVKALFGGDVEGRDLALVTDTWSQTVALVMADEGRAVPWMQPADLKLRAGGSPGLLGKSLGGFLVTMGDGETHWLPLSGAREKYPALFTINGGEKVSLGSITRPTRDAQEYFVKYLERDKEQVPTEDIDSLIGEFKSLQAGGFSGGSSSGSGSEEQEDNRPPVPDAEKIAVSREKLKRAFEKDMRDIKTGNDKRYAKREYALLFLSQLDNVQSDPVDAYVLLDTARNQAMEAGDYAQAMKATEELTQRYKVDTFKYTTEALVSVSDHLLFREQNSDVKDKAKELLRLALSRDDFPTANKLFDVLSESIRRDRAGGNGPPAAGRGGVNEMAMIPIIRKEIADRESAFKGVSEALEILKKAPEDKEANLVAGRYYALVKMDWKTGAKYLMKGSNLRLRVLATEDAGPPADAVAMANLADEYMSQAELEGVAIYKRGLKFRAVYWYQLALPGMPQGLDRVKAERKVEEVKAEKDYREIIEQAMEIMEANGNLTGGKQSPARRPAPPVPEE